MTSKEKQQHFMQAYEKMHVGFVKYCKAHAYGIMDYKDLHSEAVTRAFEGFEKLKNKTQLPAYIYGITKNIIKNELRKKSNANRYEHYKAQEEPIINNNAEQNLNINTLYRALKQLSSEQKEAIVLFEISGYSIKEIAEMQKSTVSSVKQRLKRGREKLLQILLQEERIREVPPKSVRLLSLFL